MGTVAGAVKPAGLRDEKTESEDSASHVIYMSHQSIKRNNKIAKYGNPVTIEERLGKPGAVWTADQHSGMIGMTGSHVLLGME